MTDMNAESALLAGVFAHAAAGLMILRTNGVILRANPGAGEMFRCNADQLAGRHIATLIAAADRERFLARLAEVARGNVPNETLELALVAPSGTPIDARISIASLRGPDGVISHMVATLANLGAGMPAEKTWRSSRAMLRLLADNLPMIIAYVDGAESYRLANRTAEEYFGCVPGEMIGKSVREILGPQGYEAVRYHLRAALAGEVQRFGREIVLPSGKVRTIEATYIPDVGKDGIVAGVLAIVADVTERKSVERAMQEAKDSAERANRAKSEFLSQMSHELRTPLNAIIGFAQLLRVDPQSLPTPGQASHIDDIMAGSQHLLDLINDILDLSAIDAGRVAMTIEPVAPGAAIAATLDLARPLAAGHGISLDWPLAEAAAPLVLADATRLKQILLNLVSNAIKYNNPQGWVAIALSATGSSVRIEVADTGPGIAPEKHEELFRPFSRLGVEASGIQGTGIGLALTKRLVETMGGMIGFTSDLGKGTKFWIELPLAPEGAIAESSRPTVVRDAALGTAPGEHRVVLYIEDNRANAKLMEGIFSRHPDWTLEIAPDAEIGLGLARTQRYDLILMDMQLPGMDGMEAMERLKREGTTSGIPVIAISANAVTDYIARARDAGFRDYLTKPIQVSELIAAIERHLPPRAA